MDAAVYCADIGSVRRGNFGWARGGSAEPLTEGSGGTEIADLVEAVANDLAAGHPVALGIECPLFVPVPEEPLRLGLARSGDGNRAWSAGPGTGALATGIVEVAWILTELRRRVPKAKAYLDWTEFCDASGGIFLWEAFVSGPAKGVTNADDAAIAVSTFCEALPDPTMANAVTAERPWSLIGASLVWSGWSSEIDLLHTPCLVIKAVARVGENV